MKKIPLAANYRVGEPAASGGKWLVVRRRLLRAGESLPNMSLALTVTSGVSIDLEQTYMRAALIAQPGYQFKLCGTESFDGAGRAENELRCSVLHGA